MPRRPSKNYTTRSVPSQSGQGDLFNTKPYHRVHDQESTYCAMEASTLVAWRQKVFTFQQTLHQQSQSQASLFPLETPYDPDAVEPFALTPFPEEFYRWPDHSDACIYFVIDRTLPLLLYIGQTLQSRQRWQGIHGCKQYLHNYRSVHNNHSVPVKIHIAFWWDVPTDRAWRQQLEKHLILKWRSPFNKENWHYWNTPFVS